MNEENWLDRDLTRVGHMEVHLTDSARLNVWHTSTSRALVIDLEDAAEPGRTVATLYLTYAAAAMLHARLTLELDAKQHGVEQ